LRAATKRRIYSRYLALQIKACEANIFSQAVETPRLQTSLS
jgi:hypothetical protein